MSKKSFKELAIPHFKEVFELIDEVLEEQEVAYYLLGASALAIELLEQGIKPQRKTRDIDFAVLVSNREEYTTLLAKLVDKGFSLVNKIPHRVYHDKYNVEIDLMPFGNIEENHFVKLEKVDLHVLGLQEVLSEVRKLEIDNCLVAVPPLPAILLLKIIAWNDRPDRRGHDLADIWYIIEYYFDYDYDHILSQHFDLIPEIGDFDTRQISAAVLGRKLQSLLSKSEPLKELVLRLLQDNLEEVESSAIAKEWASLNDLSLSYTYSILEKLYASIH